jgi:hypothetical protein
MCRDPGTSGPGFGVYGRKFDIPPPLGPGGQPFARENQGCGKK